MSKAFKQLCAGFFSSLMVMTLILAPIPKVDIAWAADAKDCYEEGKDGETSRVYKPGCNLDGIVEKTKMESYTEHQSSIMAILEQAVAGMMAVVLVQSLFHGYLYEVDPTLYGNDCNPNIAGKYTIRIAQLGALAYLLGDIKANMTFQEASKMATDSAFGQPAEGMDNEGHKNKQLRSMETLIEVFEKQKKGLKAKKALSMLAEGAYAASLGIELAGIGYCTGQCATNLGLSESYFAKFGAMLSAAQGVASAKIAAASACPGPTCNPPGAAACTAAQAQLAALGAAMSASKASQVPADLAETETKRAQETAKEFSWTGLWTSIKSFFSGPAGGEVDKVSGLPMEDALDDAARAAELGQETPKLGAQMASDQTLIGTVVAAVQTCSKMVPVDGGSFEVAAKSALNAYVNYKYAPIECCGSEGMSLPQQQMLVANNTILEGQIGILSGEPTMTSALNIAKSEATKKAAESAAGQGFDKIALGLVPGLPAPPANPFEAMGKAQMIKGTLPGYGVAKSPKFASTKDMRMFGIFGDEDKSASLESSHDFKYYVKNNFESLLRKIAITSQVDSFDEKNISQELKEVADLEQKVNSIMFMFDRLVEDSDAKSLAAGEFNKHELWPSIVEKISNLIMPKAHAFLSSVGGQMAAGVGLSMLSKQLGLKGPWSALLNVGGQFMIMNALLGKFAKSWGFVKPKGRAYTWGALAAVNLLVIGLDNKALKKIDQYIEALKSEKKRYEEAVGIAGVADGEDRDGSGKLKLRDGANAQNFAIGGGPIKSCAVPKGAGFAPAPCPAQVQKSKFTVPKMGRTVTGSVTPNHLDSISFVSDFSHGLASGKKGVDDLAALDLDKIESRNKAMRDFNSKLMKKVDNMEKKINEKQKAKPSALESLIAKAKKGISSAPMSQPLASLGAKTSSTPAQDKDEKEAAQNPVTVSSAYGDFKGGNTASTAPKPLDFGFDDGGVETEEEAARSAAKTEESLEDFVLQHDDINKRKDVSIFKILSNRYLLSYPKVLEERDSKE